MIQHYLAQLDQEFLTG